MKHLLRNYIALILFLSLAFTFFIGCDDAPTNPPSPPNYGPALFVANQGGGSGALSIVTLNNDAVQKNTVGLGLVPNEILKRGDTLYVLNSVSNDLNVLKISSDHTAIMLDTIDVGRDRNMSPYAAAFDRFGYLWITNFNDGTVSVFDVQTQSSIAYIPVGSGPAGIKIVNDKAYVCVTGYNNGSYAATGIVRVISTSTNRVVKTIEVGMNPQYMALDRNNRLHVVCTGNYDHIYGEINVLETSGDSLYNVIQFHNSFPGSITITPRNQAYLVASSWEGPGKIMVYDASTSRILRTILTPIETGAGAHSLISNNNNEVFVACLTSNTVEKIVDMNVVTTYDIGEGPGPLIYIDF